MPLSTGRFSSLKVISLPRVGLTLFLALILLQPIAYAADSCSVWNEIEFTDGTKACMTDYEFFNMPILEGESTVEKIKNAGLFFLATVKDYQSCPIREGLSFVRANNSITSRQSFGNRISSPAGSILKQCEDQAITSALKSGVNPEKCECENLIENGGGVGKLFLTKQQFEKRSADYLALVPQKDRLTAFAGKPGSVPIQGGSEALKPRIVAAPVPIKVDESKLLQAELEKKQQLDKEQKLLAEKLRAEQEKKIVEEKRAQLELAKREETDRLQKLADEKRTQETLAKQQQAEKEKQLLAEKARQEQDLAKRAQLEKEQKELAEKTRLEEAKRFAEEKRIQVEQAQRAKQQEELAQKAKQDEEKRTAEANRIQADLAKIQALEKEKAELISKMQQSGDVREKTVAETPGGLSKTKQGSSNQTTKSVKALVIGNSSYGVASLPNPVNDAQAIAKRLTDFGFSVDLVLDGNRKQLISALTKYQRDSAKYEVNILFYAGHGIQMGGINYIIPTDMSLAPGGGNVEFEAIPVNAVVEKYMQANTKLVFLDACRDNPLSRSMLVATRGAGGAARGLAPIDVGGGTLISFSTKDGNVALDGDGKNSPYTEALLTHMNERVDISLMLRKVRKSVMTKTNGKQVPWDYGSLLGDELILSNK